jgi:hypothetical protein
VPFTGIHEKVPELSVNDDGECILAKEEMSIDRTDCAVNIIVDSAEDETKTVVSRTGWIGAGGHGSLTAS